MGHIKEPKGVDFVINGKPLTKEEELAISQFIRESKAKNKSKQPGKRNRKVAARNTNSKSNS